MNLRSEKEGSVVDMEKGEIVSIEVNELSTQCEGLQGRK